MRKISGFTLIELIIVIAIIGILATVLVVIINPATQIKKARDAGRKTALKQVQNALEQYYADNGVYPVPPTQQGLSGSCSSNPGWNCWDNSSTNPLLGAQGSKYLATMPQDPSFFDDQACAWGNTTSRLYSYYTPDNGQSYILVTRIETLDDPSVQPGAPNYYNGAAPLGGCTGFANYKLVNQQ